VSATEGLKGNQMVKKVSSLFDLHKQNKRRLFIVLIFFLLSFAMSRLYSLYFHFYVYISGYHIHHFYFGALTLALGGILGILNNNDNKKRLFIACALIGIGMGLFADEIGLLLNSTNRTGMSEYFFPESGDIIITIACGIVFLIAIADTDFKSLKQKCSSLRSVFQGHN
jgi:Na+/melibiose symporter-like transporter